MYRHIGETRRRIRRENQQLVRERAIAWRRGPTIVRVEKPLHLDRARRLGYRAKQGFVVARVRVGKGGMRRARPRSGRRPKHLGVSKIKASVGAREVAERRAAKRFPNLKALNSYLLYEDGKYKFFEVIMVDPHHPSIRSAQELRHVLGPLLQE